jgi:orotidine-5'-phosphate decarboxylase
MDFKTKLTKIIKKNNSLVSVGLDIDKSKMPDFLFKQNKNPYIDFNKQIIDTTKDLVCAYKINMAFYEVLKDGYKILKETIDYIPKDIVVILDGKRNDIGNTAKMYASSLFDFLKADSTTVNPYLGLDGVKPFLEHSDKCSFILCRTSNASAKDFQDLKIQNVPLYEKVAEKIKEWNNKFGNCGVVVGATYPEELKKIREILGEDIPFLIPGVGKQGGDVEKTVENGTNSDGSMAVINSSRGIIYAGSNDDFALKSREKTKELKNEINSYR